MNGLSRPVLSALIAVVIFAAGIAIGWFGRGSSSVPADVPTVAIYDGWRVSCPAAQRADLPCAIANDLIQSGTQRRIAQLTMVPGKTGTVLVVTTPYDVLLTYGVGLVVGNAKPQFYPYLTCNTDGCVAQIPLGDNAVAQMQQATQGKLLIGSLDRKTVQIVFSLKGFSRAQDALKAHQNKHSFFGI